MMGGEWQGRKFCAKKGKCRDDEERRRKEMAKKECESCSHDWNSSVVWMWMGIGDDCYVKLEETSESTLLLPIKKKRWTRQSKSEKGIKEDNIYSWYLHQMTMMNNIDIESSWGIVFSVFYRGHIPQMSSWRENSISINCRVRVPVSFFSFSFQSLFHLNDRWTDWYEMKPKRDHVAYVQHSKKTLKNHKINLKCDANKTQLSHSLRAVIPRDQISSKKKFMSRKMKKNE